MKQGTLELIFFALIFLSLQLWWIRMTIKNGRTGEVDKWGQKTNPKKLKAQTTANKKYISNMLNEIADHYQEN